MRAALSILLAFGMTCTLAGAAATPAALAAIDVETVSGGLQIIGKAVGIATATIRGEMVIDRKGASGSVTTRQSAEWTLESGQTREIARVGVSFREGDTLKVTVTLTRDGTAIASASTSVP